MIVPPFLADFLLPLRAERRRFGAMIDVQLPHNTAPEREKHNGHKYADQTLSPNLTIHRGLKKQIREPHNLRNLQKTTPILSYLKTTNVCPEEDTFANTNQPKTKSHKHHSMLDGGGLVQLSVEGHSTEKNVHQIAKRAQNRTDEHTAARSGMNMAA